MGRTLSLETSTCRRTLSADGFLTEMVRLDGARGGLTDEEVEKFVEGFPVEGAYRGGVWQMPPTPNRYGYYWTAPSYGRAVRPLS
jgi:hypothetical protein